MCPLHIALQETDFGTPAQPLEKGEEGGGGEREKGVMSEMVTEYCLLVGVQNCACRTHVESGSEH